MAPRPKKILFIAECVTLAHMARPAVLAKSLEDAPYEVVLASDGRYDGLFSPLQLEQERIFSISSERFLKALEKGQPLYDKETLHRYVEDDLALFERTKPDVVVGDFRLSLSVSARIAKIPYVTISNIYWSPYAKQHYPVPELPITRTLGVPLAQLMFSIVRPVAFALHTRPLNAVRKQFGLKPLGLDLRRTYTDADLTLYADVPGLVETEALPPNHRYIGPVLWSPEVPTPDWWDQIEPSQPIIYLTPGSSGSVDKLTTLAAALASLPATVLVATAGRELQKIDIPSVYAADFLPGTEAAIRADLVVCNGGSPTTGQALATGTPVVGVSSNLDQYLNMNALANAGLGLMVRSEQVTPERLRASAEAILNDRRFRQRAAEMQTKIVGMQSAERFRHALDKFI